MVLNRFDHEEFDSESTGRSVDAKGLLLVIKERTFLMTLFILHKVRGIIKMLSDHFKGNVLVLLLVIIVACLALQPRQLTFRWSTHISQRSANNTQSIWPQKQEPDELKLSHPDSTTTSLPPPSVIAIISIAKWSIARIYPLPHWIRCSLNRKIISLTNASVCWME